MNYANVDNMPTPPKRTDQAPLMPRQPDLPPPAALQRRPRGSRAGKAVKERELRARLDAELASYWRQGE